MTSKDYVRQLVEMQMVMMGDKTTRCPGCNKLFGSHENSESIKVKGQCVDCMADNVNVKDNGKVGHWW